MISGAMVVALGPVRARFAGSAHLAYDDAAQSGRVEGGGQDQGGATRLTAAASFRVRPADAGSLLEVDIDYTLRGTLAQLAKGRVVDLLAGEIAALFARNLAARLRGDAPQQARPLGAGLLSARMAWLWLRSLFRRHG